jgi:hypothetical protein
VGRNRHSLLEAQKTHHEVAGASCVLGGFVFLSRLREAPIYWQSGVGTYSIGPSSKLQGYARTCRADSKSSYSACRILRQALEEVKRNLPACRPLQRAPEEAKRIQQVSGELLPALPRHARPRNLPLARCCGRKRIFGRNLSKSCRLLGHWQTGIRVGWMELTRAVLSEGPYADGHRQKQDEAMSLERAGPPRPCSTTAPHGGAIVPL